MQLDQSILNALLSRQVSHASRQQLKTSPAANYDITAAVSQLLMQQNNAIAASAVGATIMHQQVNKTGTSSLKNRARITFDRSVSAPCGIKGPVGAQRAHMQPCSSKQHSNGKNVLNPNRYKTEMCRTFVENGFCKYGNKCQFAHGSTEQRLLPRHPKYKTEYCKTYHDTGFCTYGARCHFIHNEDEGKLLEIQLLKRQQTAAQAAEEVLRHIQQQNQLLESTMKRLVSQQLHIAAPPRITPENKMAARPCLQHSISVHPFLRLGSVADTPPGSPILSPSSQPVSDDASSTASTYSDASFTLNSCDFNSTFNFTPSANILSPPSTPSSSPRKISTGSCPDVTPPSPMSPSQHFGNSNSDFNTSRLPFFISWKTSGSNHL